ncbi:MAG: nucleotide sugar dehydrogenase [Candidatus Marinimicrobia bacterium]|nr:nucleotide sugar dehydrogenase [Candidatus Neomarinimicrobiota bacterium]
MNNLKLNIQNRDACIAVIGLGYVGLPLVIRFSEEGFKTIGFDIDEDKVKKLNAGETYIKHIPEEKIAAVVKNGFKATSDFSQISNVDAIIICVPTPLGIHNEPDLSYIKNTLSSIKPYLKESQLLVLESTTYPGTTEEEIIPFIQTIKNSSLLPTRREGRQAKSSIENQKFTIGVNFYVGYSPEREDPGNKNYTTKTIPKVVSGYTKNCLELTKTLYDQIVDQTVPVSSPRVAEMTKILENIHRAVNIGLVNELKMVADKMDIDIYEVIKAAATKPFGFTPYYPGPGLGGHCIPIDPFYLTWKAKEVGMNTRFIELAGEINTGMPNYVVQKVGDALNAAGKSIKGSRILVLGLAYKKNVDDTRESPSLTIMEMLIKMGADVQYSDPYLPEAPKTRKFNFDLKSIDLTAENIKSFDALVLSTDHDSFDYKMIEKEAKLIIDTRGKINDSEKVIKA